MTATTKLKDTCSLEGNLYDKTRQSIKKKRHHFAVKGLCSQAVIFSVVMYGYESWTIKKAEHWRTHAFELRCWRRLFASSLDCKEMQPVNPKGNHSWLFIRKTDAEAGAPILWSPDAKSLLTGKDPDVGKDWGQEKGSNRGWDGCIGSLTQWIWI